ncbi:hypothetical protein FOZ63_018149 [Perkinsus olseni]|uniref:Uncharacterized protein n=1 Tax=Perkinsus olseni TaxID=32597 RepID=A0A7J6STK5_PEROL|nr:hypothetical protein FOZ63_018149 [Perkinsus olseni]
MMDGTRPTAECVMTYGAYPAFQGTLEDLEYGDEACSTVGDTGSLGKAALTKLKQRSGAVDQRLSRWSARVESYSEGSRRRSNQSTFERLPIAMRKNAKESACEPARDIRQQYAPLITTIESDANDASSVRLSSKPHIDKPSYDEKAEALSEGIVCRQRPRLAE